MYVISSNPVIKPHHTKNINTYIANDGSKLVVFRHIHHAVYAKNRFANEHYVVKTDLDTLRQYSEHNKLFNGLKIVENIYCDIKARKEVMECHEVKNVAIF